MPHPAVSIQTISKCFGPLTALNRVSFSIEEGEFFALLGPNGAGKTTLISILAGLTRADQGQVQVQGFDVVRDYRESRRRLGVVPQELVFDPFFTVRETLRLQSNYFGIKNNDAWIDEIMGHLDLVDKADRNMRSLSGGMKRRVLVAQALVHKPPVIVLDEPTAGVDVELRQSLWAFIQTLNRQGHTIVLTTHYLEEAETLCNRIGMLKQGKLIALDDKEKLLSHSPFRQLHVQYRGSWPKALAVTAQKDDWATMQLDNPLELEAALARLRKAGVDIVDLEVSRPSLEDVFIAMMHEVAT